MTFRLDLQLKSGKNRVLTTRTGHRYAPKAFTEWRGAALQQLAPQVTQYKPLLPVQSPVRLRCDYTPSDCRVRDVDGMLGALLHVIVKAGLLVDDGQVYEVEWTRQAVNREKPGLMFSLEQL
jgi:Holliday junction resolvase RusA-like endonuclease